MMEIEAKQTSMAEPEAAEGVGGGQRSLSAGAMHRHLRTPLYANAYYLMGNTIALSLSGFLFWTVAARLYDAAEVGMASALISASLLVVSISALGLGTGLIRFLPTAEDPWRMIATAAMVSAPLSVLSGAVFLWGARVWAPQLAFVVQQPLLFCAFVVFSVGGLLSGFVDSIFVGQRRAKYTFLKGLVVGIGRILLLIGLSFFAGAFAIFGAGGLITACVAGVALWWIWGETRNVCSPGSSLGTGDVRDLVDFSVANYVADLIYRAPTMLLPLLVLHVLGPEANGYFYVSWMLGGLLAIVPGAMSSSLLAEGSQFQTRLRGDSLGALLLSLALVLPAVVVAFLLADKLLLLFGRAYSEAGGGLLRILILAALPILFNSVYFSVKRVQKKISAIVALSAVIAAGSLGLSYLLMPRLGLRGVGIAWLASQSAAAAMVFLSLRKRYGMLFASMRAAASLADGYGGRRRERD